MTPRIPPVRPTAITILLMLTAVVCMVIWRVDFTDAPTHFWTLIGGYATGVILIAQKLIDGG